MSHLSRRSLLLGSISLAALPKAELEQQYLFATDEYEIRMTLEYHDNEPNPGLRFEERSTDRRFCLSAQGEEDRNCLSGFNGSIAVARYRIKPHRGSQASPQLREQVRSIDQSDHVPARPPFERIIEARHGLASDIQVFGYQEEAAESRKSPQGPDDAWCLLRQNLYLKDSQRPFLIVHWKHTLSSIRVLDVIPDNGTWRVRQVE